MLLLTLTAAWSASIPVAVRPLPPGTVVTAADLYIAILPDDHMLDDWLVTPELVIGRTTIEVILKDEPFRRERFADPSRGEGRLATLPRDHQLFHLTAAEPLVELRPGNWVDLMGSVNGRMCVVAEAVPVVSVQDATGQASASPWDALVVTAFDVAVTAEVAATLQNVPQIDVSLRSPLDVRSVQAVLCDTRAPARVVVNGDRPTRVAPTQTARARPLVAGRNAFVGELWVEPLAQIPVHRDATEEFLVVLAGEGMLTIDGTAQPLRKGMSVYMPALAEVSFVNGPNRFHALQVFAGPAPASKYNAWPVAPQAR